MLLLLCINRERKAPLLSCTIEFHVLCLVIHIIHIYITGCPSPAPMFNRAPNVRPGLVSISWTAAGSSDPLLTGVRYALYSRCGAEATFQLIDDDIQGLSYDITTLPSLTQCALRVVVYSDHCLLDVNGPLENTTDPFTTGKAKQQSNSNVTDTC